MAEDTNAIRKLPAEGSVRRSVYDCIVDLHNANRLPSRQAIADALQLKFSQVDPHVKELKDEGFIRLVFNGVFEPVELVADRAISVTFANGRVKVEVGDVVLDLNMREGRALSMGTAGISLLFAR